MSTFVKVPNGLFDRLVFAAENHHARQGSPILADAGWRTLFEAWLHDLERERVAPTPHAEPGDLLVKASRGELWTFTVEGWRELAPVELQAEPVEGPGYREVRAKDAWPPRPSEFGDGDPMPGAEARKGFTLGNDPTDARAGAGGACGIHGVYSGVVCPGCREVAQARVTLAQERVRVAELIAERPPHAGERVFDAEAMRPPPRYWGKGAVEEALDERAAEADRKVEDLHGTPSAAGPPWPLFVQDVLDDLAERSNVLHTAAGVLTDAEAVAERDLLDSIRAFADGIDDARRLLLVTATKACR